MGKYNLLIMGDSYSTFEGAIPKGNECYYKKDLQNFEDYKVLSFEDSWVSKFLKLTDCNLVLNESSSGSTICNRGYEGVDSMKSFIRRLTRCEDQELFKKGKVDTVIVMGGTNDSWADSEIGDVMYGDISGKDRLKVVPGMSYFIGRLRNDFKIKNILFVINSEEIKEEIQEKYIEVLNHYSVPYTKISGFTKINGHPDGDGMTCIAKTVSEAFKENFS